MNNANGSVRPETNQDSPSLTVDSVAQQDAYVLEYADSSDPLAEFITACRFKAVIGEWPEGVPPAVPDLIGIHPNWVRWLMSQKEPNKLAKGLRKRESEESHLKQLRRESASVSQIPANAIWMVVSYGAIAFSTTSKRLAIDFIREHVFPLDTLFVSSDVARNASTIGGATC